MHNPLCVDANHADSCGVGDVIGPAINNSNKLFEGKIGVLKERARTRPHFSTFVAWTAPTMCGSVGST